MLNKITLIGNVGKDPEVRNMQNSGVVANFSLATSESWKDKSSGERKQTTEWHRVVCFNEKLSEVIKNYVHKGDKLYVEGMSKTRKWTDQKGVERYSTEVVLSKFGGMLVMLGSPGGARQPGEDRGEDQGQPASNGKQATRTQVDLDDDIPF